MNKEYFGRRGKGREGGKTLIFTPTSREQEKEGEREGRKKGGEL